MSNLTCLASIGRRDDTIPLRDSSLVYGPLINLDCSSSYDPRKKLWSFLTSSSSSWHTKTHRYFCPSVTKPSPNLRKIHRHVQVPTQEFAGILHTGGLTCQRCATLWFVGVHWRLCPRSPCFTEQAVEGRPQQSSIGLYSCPILRKRSKICFLQWHCYRKPFSAFHAFTTQYSRILKQN